MTFPNIWGKHGPEPLVRGPQPEADAWVEYGILPGVGEVFEYRDPSGGRMSVKNLLMTQTAGFISLHDVLTRMTQIDGATYQEAATALHRVLWGEDEKSRPAWYVCDNLYGKRIASNSEEMDAWVCLRQAVHQGMPSDRERNEIPF